jgi:hypothetical protein
MLQKTFTAPPPPLLLAIVPYTYTAPVTSSNMAQPNACPWANGEEVRPDITWTKRKYEWPDVAL